MTARRLLYSTVQRPIDRSYYSGRPDLPNGIVVLSITFSLHSLSTTHDSLLGRKSLKEAGDQQFATRGQHPREGIHRQFFFTIAKNYHVLMSTQNNYQENAGKMS